MHLTLLKILWLPCRWWDQFKVAKKLSSNTLHLKHTDKHCNSHLHMLLFHCTIICPSLWFVKQDVCHALFSRFTIIFLSLDLKICRISATSGYRKELEHILLLSTFHKWFLSSMSTSHFYVAYFWMIPHTFCRGRKWAPFDWKVFFQLDYSWNLITELICRL